MWFKCRAGSNIDSRKVNWLAKMLLQISHISTFGLGLSMYRYDVKGTLGASVVDVLGHCVIPVKCIVFG